MLLPPVHSLQMESENCSINECHVGYIHVCISFSHFHGNLAFFYRASWLFLYVLVFFFSLRELLRTFWTKIFIHNIGYKINLKLHGHLQRKLSVVGLLPATASSSLIALLLCLQFAVVLMASVLKVPNAIFLLHTHYQKVVLVSSDVHF